MKLIQFLFIVVLPLVVVAGGLVSLFALGAVFEALDNPKAVRSRVEGLFRARPVTGRETGKDHYYQPYWARKPGPTKP
jgi:hypothetical protein